jgi:hypothetical protein
MLRPLQRAAEFMREVRKGQAQRDKGMTGGIFLEPAQLAAIEAAVVDSNLARSVEEVPQMDGAVFRTARIFEEMCRRQNVDVGESMRPLVVRLLASELLANKEALPEAQKGSLESFTALQGGVGPELKQEFGERFRNSRSYFTGAVNCASHPREYLQEMASTHTGKYTKKASSWTAEVERGGKEMEESSPSSPQK